METLSEIWTTIRSEFADLPDVEQTTRVTLRLLVAVLLGGLVGYEREKRESAAGLRTHMLVALGSALFVVVPIQAGIQPADMSRVLQGVIAGVGFLGAGAIIKVDSKEQVLGLTSAASIWTTAAIGVAAGMGRETTALLSAVFTLVILALVRRFAKKARRGGQSLDGKTGSPEPSEGRPTDAHTSRSSNREEEPPAAH